LAACDYLSREESIVMLPAGEIGRPLMQGCSALAAPKLGSDEDRRLIMIRDFFLLQLPSFAVSVNHLGTGASDVK
jgi:hypothetical protein